MKVEIIKQVDGGLPIGAVDDFSDEIAEMLINAGRAKSIADKGDHGAQVNQGTTNKKANK